MAFIILILMLAVVTARPHLGDGIKEHSIIAVNRFIWLIIEFLQKRWEITATIRDHYLPTLLEDCPSLRQLLPVDQLVLHIPFISILMTMIRTPILALLRALANDINQHRIIYNMGLFATYQCNELLNLNTIVCSNLTFHSSSNDPPLFKQ